MNFYSITYDLIRVKDYEKISKGIIRSCDDMWVRPTESQWIIATEKTSAQIKAFLSAYLDYDDVLFVAKIDVHDLAWLNIPTEVSDWLRIL